MSRAVWNIVIGTPPLIGVAILILVRPFLAAQTREYAIAAAVALLAAGLGLALVRNRLTIGTWTRSITPQQRSEIRSRARASQIMTLATFGALSLVGLPLVFWVRKQGWSQDATLFAALLAAIPVSGIMFFMTRRWGNPSGTSGPDGR